jgi:soluble lytic murein transglycosylase-like protein
MKRKLSIFLFLLLSISYSQLVNACLLQERRYESVRDNIDYRYFSELLKVYPWLDRNLYDIIRIYSAEHGVDHLLVLAVIQAESNGYILATGKPVTYNKNGEKVTYRARGYMQVMPFHVNYPADLLYIPHNNIDKGTYILANSLRLSKGNLYTALKNYNSGPASAYYDWDYIRKIVTYYQRTR